MQSICESSVAKYRSLSLKSIGRVMLINTGWFLAILTMLLAPAAQAQFGSSISGTVLDSSKAAIPNASVTLTNTATQQVPWMRSF